jgi:hypothetical protein
LKFIAYHLLEFIDFQKAQKYQSQSKSDDFLLPAIDGIFKMFNEACQSKADERTFDDKFIVR